jgi:hypothetical protein
MAGLTDNTYGSRHYVEGRATRRIARHAEGDGLVDMIGDRDLVVRRDTNSTPWLTDLVWGAARRLALDNYFVPESTRVEDDHLPFPRRRRALRRHHRPRLRAVAHCEGHPGCVSAPAASRSLADVVLAALPQIEARFVKGPDAERGGAGSGDGAVRA